MDLDKALATQLANIEKRSGKSLAELAAIIAKSGLTKHTEIVAMLKADLGLGHGDANTVVHLSKQAAAPASAANADPLDAIRIKGTWLIKSVREDSPAVAVRGGRQVAGRPSVVSTMC